jgi:putative DNA primase/helicase
VSRTIKVPTRKALQARVRKAFKQLERGEFDIGKLARFGRYSSAMGTTLKMCRSLKDDPEKRKRFLDNRKAPDMLTFRDVFHGNGRRSSPAQIRKDHHGKVDGGAQAEEATGDWVTADKMESQLGELKWLWPGWIPAGQFTILGAQAGKGKSALAMRLCQSVTTGAPWPDGQAGPADSKPVIWVETERRERLNAQRRVAFGVPPDLMVVHKLRKPFRIDVPTHLDSLRQAIAEHEPGLVVIDSLRAGHRLSENSPKVGDLLQELDILAADLRVAILLVHHFRKKVQSKTAERVTPDELRGSSTIADRPLSILALDEPNPEGDPKHIRLSHVKCNVGAERPSLGMRWKGTVLEFDDEPPQPPAKSSIGSQVGQLIKKIVANGPQPALVVQQLVEQAGFNFKTAQDVKDDYGVESVKQGKGWIWRLKK